ncbi:MAG: 23S rRNA (adenine(2503)-C(2))-methyltransferase RlmN [Proteobacteria bacterium]|nr:23S rRNA (adenine(2503)-C(2))-methyltransferase RlmN [Pseudomonadota bacterium]
MAHILNFSFEDVKEILAKANLKPFKAKQLWDWAHVKGVLNPDNMSNISKADIEVMTHLFEFDELEIAEQQDSKDGTIKWLFKLKDGHEIETVYIPEDNRGTLCISAQVGCALNCRFCHTGTQGFSRNLTKAEIVGQVHKARSVIEDWNGRGGKRNVTNVVFMGMGEPLYNYDNVKKACQILMCDHGQGYGTRKITISTSGVVDHIVDISESLGVNLAVSIHSANDETRSKIMPINKKHNLQDLIGTIKNFKFKEKRKIFWEYSLLKGINDSVQDAHDLCDLIEGIPSKINLIGYNSWPGSPFEASSEKTLNKFYLTLQKRGVLTTIRKSRGEDILAACGQLRSESSKINTVSIDYPSTVKQYGSEIQKNKLKTK